MGIPLTPQQARDTDLDGWYDHSTISVSVNLNLKTAFWLEVQRT